MPTTHNMVLRPRFQIELEENNATILQAFETYKTSQSVFVVTRLDDHVFIKFQKAEQHFWSPQLHLEINKTDTDSSLLHGLYGPSPTVWTLFMFLHFMVAAFFLGFGIWSYTNWSLKKDFALPFTFFLLMILIWFVLYFAGRIGRDSSKKDMLKLRDFMNKVLKNKKL